MPIAALFAMMGAILTLVNFGKLVESISNGPSDVPGLVASEKDLEILSDVVQQNSTEILAAISNLDRQEFLAKMAVIMADADQAGDAMSEWNDTRDPTRRASVLDTSEAGLTNILELYRNRVYPGESMVVVLARLLLTRLATFSAFEGMRSDTDTKELQDALNYLSQSTESIAAWIQAQNQVHVSNSTIVHQGNLRTPGWISYIVTVTYANIRGDVTYKGGAASETSQEDAQAKAQPSIAAANQASAQGLSEDLDYAQVTKLREIIQAISPVIG
jgi:hypothetical protein